MGRISISPVSRSMPMTSLIAVTLRVPSERRLCCTMRWTLDGDLLADGAQREIEAGHEDERLEARDGLRRASSRASS